MTGAGCGPGGWTAAGLPAGAGAPHGVAVGTGARIPERTEVEGSEDGAGGCVHSLGR